MAKLKYTGDIVAGAALEGASVRLGPSTTIVTGAGVLQNVTLSAALITAGSLPDARLSSNVPLLNATENAFTGILRATSYKLGVNVIVTGAGVLQNVTLSAGLITAGTLADAQLSANVPLLNAVENAFTGILRAASYKLGASTIITSGGVLQNVTLSAALINAGTLADGRLSSNIPLLNAVENIFTGTLNATVYKLGASVIVTSGGVLQNVTLSAALITSGALADARLSANVALLSAAATTFAGTIAGTTITASGALVSGNGTSGVLRARKTDTTVTSLISYDEATDKMTFNKAVVGLGSTVVPLGADTNPALSSSGGTMMGLSVTVAAGEVWRFRWVLVCSNAAGNVGGLVTQIISPTANTAVATAVGPLSSLTSLATVGHNGTTGVMTLAVGAGFMTGTYNVGVAGRAAIIVEARIDFSAAGTIDIKLGKNTSGDTYTCHKGSYLVADRIS